MFHGLPHWQFHLDDFVMMLHPVHLIGLYLPLDLRIIAEVPLALRHLGQVKILSPKLHLRDVVGTLWFLFCVIDQVCRFLDFDV